MKRSLLLGLIMCCIVKISAQVSFADYFENKTLRVDFTLAGDAEHTEAYLSRLLEEPHWGGRQAHLDTSLRLGDFLIILIDTESGKTIYEEGFATLFEEWQDTEEATRMKRSYPNSVILPFPKKTCRFYIIQRQNGEFTDTLMNIEINPKGKEIEKASLPHFETDTLVFKSSPKNALDIVILAEGFKDNEMDEFKKMSKELSSILMTSEVFKHNEDRINCYSVCSVSDESGADNPLNSTWKHTCFNASFNTLYSDRYLMIKDIQKVRDAAALVPYDQIYIIVNTDKYGGGGIYNFYSICSARSRSNDKVLIHEFGHGFAALADEYFYDDNVLIDFIDTTREPWQKNITTLVDLDSKWGDMIDPDTPIPTPDSLANKYPIGVYQGGAYVSQGVYRSSYDCRMKTNNAEDFCPVCQRCIQEVIDFITKE